MNSSDPHAVGKNAWPDLHAGWEAEFLNFSLHLNPANGPFPNGSDEGGDLDHRPKGAGYRSPVWPDRRNTQSSGVDLGSPGVLAWEEAQRGVETECWGGVSGCYL